MLFRSLGLRSVYSIPSDATNPANTLLPLTSMGARVEPFAFAGQDGSTASLNVLSTTFAQFNMNLVNQNSFGGVFLSYDDPSTNDNNNNTTSDIETFNLTTAFPNGIVLQLDNGDTDVTEMQLEVTVILLVGSMP